MFYDVDELRAFGDRPCLVMPGGWTLSYVELARSAESFALRLPTSRGVIAVEMAGEPAAISAYLGALGAGHAVMPLPAGDLESTRQLVDRFRPAAIYSRVGGRWRIRSGDLKPATLHPDLALLLQTSGSTGQGRGVRLSAQAVEANAQSISSYLGIGDGDRAALVLPLHYSYGLSVLHAHIARGASLWLASGSILDPEFHGHLAHSGATSLAGVPHHFTLLESAGLADALPESIKLLTVAGGAMEPGKVLDWHRRMGRRDGRFVVMYGQTEATARISWLPPEHTSANPGAVGIAIPGGCLSLRAPNGAEITAAHVEGELVYAGPNVMMGYATDHGDLVRGAELRDLATGDLAQRDEGGLYRITGRLSRMSKIAGLRVGHDALERGLGARGYEAAVWGDDRTISIAICGAGTGIDEAAAQLAGIGRSHFRVLPCEALPRRPNGKIDYAALKAGSADTEAPRGQGVLDAFQVTFAPQVVGRNDSFASLAGDSLRHVELSLALDSCLGTVPAGWEKMPVAALERSHAVQATTLPTEIMARVLAILAVVAAHQTLWPVYGGAAAMVILMGMSIASYRWEVLKSGDMRRFLTPLAAVLAPYYLILVGYALAWGQVPWVSVFLAGNFALTTPETHLMLPYLYWFIEAYVQMSLLVAVPFLLPPLRRWLASQGRFRVGLCFLALAIALRLTVPQLFPMGGRAQFTLPWVFYLFALGWCISSAKSLRHRLYLLAGASVVMPAAAYLGGNWYGGWIKYMSLLGLVAVLILIPRLPVPRASVRPVMRLAQAAFPIYLLHRFVPELLFPAIGWDGNGAWTDAAAIAGGVGLGLAAAALQRQFVSIRVHYRSWKDRAEA